MPAKIAPSIVPHSAAETVNPSDAGDSPYRRVRSRVVPAITAVSNPSSRPPSAATMVLLIRYALSFTLLHYGQPRDSRIGEHVIFVRAACREFGHNGAFRTGLEPVRRIRTQRIL